MKAFTVFQGDFLHGNIFQLCYYFFNNVLCGLLGKEFLGILKVILFLQNVWYKFHMNLIY